MDFFGVYFARIIKNIQCKNIAFFAFLKTDNVKDWFLLYL